MTSTAIACPMCKRAHSFFIQKRTNMPEHHASAFLLSHHHHHHQQRQQQQKQHANAQNPEREAADTTGARSTAVARMHSCQHQGQQPLSAPEQPDSDASVWPVRVRLTLQRLKGATHTQPDGRGEKTRGGSGLRFESRLGTTQRLEGKKKSAEGCKKKAGQCGLEVSGCQPAPDNDHAHSSALHLKSTYFLQPSPFLASPPLFSFLSRRPPGSRLQSRVQLA